MDIVNWVFPLQRLYHKGAKMQYWIGLILLSGCKDKDATGEPPPLGDYQTANCGSTAPIIELLSCENSGMEYESDEGTDLPTFSLISDVRDEDGDLTGYSMIIDFDEVLDEDIDADASSVLLNSAINGDPCTITEAQLKGKIFLKGGDPDYETTYEWFVTIFDEAGNRSETEMIVCTTPDEEGNGSP